MRSEHTSGPSLAHNKSGISTTVPGSAAAHVGFPLDPNYFWIFLILGTCAAALMGIALGTPVLRLRGDYLAIVTLGFGEVIRVLASNLSKPINLTNGPQGITPIQRPDLPLDLHQRRIS